MSLPQVVAVAEGSPAARAGVASGDLIAAMNGRRPRDVIEYSLLADEAELELDVLRGGLELSLHVSKAPGLPLGLEVSSALFDRVRTCDNHCEFCFIYQLPKGLRRSLYVKDDDYRLSFLYGNFTTLTRFTEADFERVVTEGLSPLYVSLHATDPAVRWRMLRNRRGATSLRWLKALLEAGIEVHGQVVVCPGVNDGEVLEDTLAGVLDEYPGLASVALVPVGVSRHSREPGLRPHGPTEAARVLEAVGEWQELFLAALGRRMVFAADEYYLLAGAEFPPAEEYEGFAQHENGVGMARAFQLSFDGQEEACPGGARGGFFAWVDGAPPEGYRAERHRGGPLEDRALGPGPGEVVILTGRYGAQVLTPLVAGPGVRVVEVENRFFGGNIAVAGLLAGQDVAAALSCQPPGARFLLPDVCLSGDRFLDGTSLSDLPRPVEVVPADGASLRRALAGSPAASLAGSGTG
jgi:putative radical SAM enzyme (TIGR03279 family)